MRFQTVSAILLASILAPLAHADDVVVLDCSPPAGVGFRAERERIFLRADGTLAAYFHTRQGTSSDDYAVALAAGVRKVAKEGGGTADVSDRVYVGVGKNGDAMQITFQPNEQAILFQRDYDDYGTVLTCMPNKRVSVDWERAKAAIADGPTSGSTLF